MERIVIDEDKKKMIYEHIQSSIGYYTGYEDAIKIFNTDGILDKELTTRLLENLMYSCKVTKFNLKPDEEFQDEKRKTDEIFKSIPRSKDFHEDDDELIYVRDTNVEEYKDMSIEEIYDNVKKCLQIEKTYKKIYYVQNLKERADATIKSITSIDENEDVSIKNREKLGQLCEELRGLTSKKKTDVKAIQNKIQSYNDIALEIWNTYLSNDIEQPRWLVHNLSRGAFEGTFDKKYMSTSLVTSKTMGLFNENTGNNFGFIIKPKNIVSASEHDTFTNNSPVINDYMEVFLDGNTPPIKLPWEIEEECIKQTIDNSGEMLNYDNRTVYSEIVVDEYEIGAMYYMSNGEGELAPNYEAAKKMSEERGIELKELDISKAREKQGLEPMTEGMQRQFLLNILRKNFMSEEQIEKMMADRSINKREEKGDIEECFIESHCKEFYKRYLQLRSNGKYAKEDIMLAFSDMVSDKEMEEMNYFYSPKKEKIVQPKIYGHEEINIEKPEIERVVQQEKTDIWKDRFKGWYGAIDRIPESARDKFIKMKSDIVNSIKSIFKERNSPTQENIQNQDTNER